MLRLSMKITVTLISLLIVATCVTAAEGPTSLKVPNSNKVTGLTLPENVQTTTDKRTVTLRAEAKYPVKWLVFNNVLGNEPDTLEFPESKTLLIFPGRKPDLLIVIAVTMIDDPAATVDKPKVIMSDMARTLIEIVDPAQERGQAQPEPGAESNPANPAPAPGAKKVKGPVHISMILDFSQQTPEIGAIVNDPQLRSWLNSNPKYKGHVLNTKSKAVTDGGLADGVKKAGGTPALVIQDGDGHILEAVKLPPAATVRKIAEKYTAE